MCSPCGNKLQIHKLGQFGGCGGCAFDDGLYQGVKKIVIYSGVVIDSIQVTYHKDCCQISGVKHGGCGGSRHEIVLSEGERIISIIGTTGSFNGVNKLVKSLVITTNKNMYGPFGTADGPQFHANVSRAAVVGFFGRSGAYVDAIGVNAAATS